MAVIAAPENTPEAWSWRAEYQPDPWTACGWSRDGQLDRFEACLDALEPQGGDRFLDWGCGTGELSEYVTHRVAYVGFDSAPGMIERARREHPGRRFQTWEPRGSFDLVACIGTFNLPDNWSKEATFFTLRRLWDRTDCRKLAVSLYAGTDDACLIYEEVELKRCARALSWSHSIERIRSNDLLLVVTR